MLSVKAKESIKTALAMTIAYGIALSMDWDKPMWVGFAVAFVSLSTVGQSLNKAALRMLGTFVAVVVALVLIALFAQDRWLFMVFISVWVGFCTYMMSGTLWFCGGDCLSGRRSGFRQCLQYRDAADARDRAGYPGLWSGLGFVLAD
jgi:hypothetical protein